MNKRRFGGKFTPDNPTNNWHAHPCHNDFNKQSCDMCVNCFSPQCDGSSCDAHNQCTCVRTECNCMGRN